MNIEPRRHYCSDLYLLVSLALLISLQGCCSEFRMPGDPGVKVITFNIRYGTAKDGENSWPHRKNLVARVIRTDSPDVFGVQEALKFQLDDLQTWLPGYRFLGTGRDDGKEGGEYTAIFYNAKRLSAQKHGTFWFSDTPSVPGSASWGNSIPRIGTWALFEDTHSRSAFYVYNVHWDHESQYSREMSAELLIRKILDRSSVHTPVLVLGDFNAAEDNPAFRKLVENRPFSLRDSYRVLHPDEENVGTFNGFEGVFDGAKIDAILISEGLRVISADIVRTNQAGRYPSDHFPVTATIGFGSQPD